MLMMQAIDGLLLALLLPLVAHSEKDGAGEEKTFQGHDFQGDVRIGEEKTFQGHAVDLQWLGEDQSVVLLRTEHREERGNSWVGRLYRSEDGGETWVDLLTTKFNLPANVSNNIGRLVRSPADANTVFAQGKGEEHFLSMDAGKTWTMMRRQGNVQGFLFHPSRKTWALVSLWTEACLPGGKAGVCSHNLYVTKDTGRTFSLVQTHVVQFSWGKPMLRQADRVYFTHFRNKNSSQQRLVRWLHGVDFAFTDDLGVEEPAKATELVPDGNKFQISYEYILVVKVTDPAKQNVSLMVSSDGGKSFSPALLPGRLWQHSYALLDASEGALVLHVNQGLDVGDVFISDPSGKNFSASLSRNRRVGGLCAFEKVMNLNGIFIANVYEKSNQTRPVSKHAKDENEDIEAASTETQTETMTALRGRRLEAEVAACPGHDEHGLEGCPVEVESQRQRARRIRASRASLASDFRRLSRVPGQAMQDHIRTVISTDAGGFWSYLTAPKKDSLGKPTKCEGKEGCWLHLHDFTDLPTFSPVYSYRNAVGILMASGNIGPYLSRRLEDTNTYLSRDGGLNWMEVNKGTHIYEFGNHGGLLVKADMIHPTTTATFSWDEGRTWLNFTIADQPLKVDNIIIEPNAASTKFLLYGTRNNAGISRFLDFGKVHQRNCTGLLTAGDRKSDYEMWSTPCIQGEKGMYTRRKQQAKCFNAEKTERYRRSSICNCSQSSYECEVGFHRKLGSWTCVLTSTSALNRGVMVGCIRGSMVEVPMYRKVPGNKCEGGWHPPAHHQMECTEGLDPPTEEGKVASTSSPAFKVMTLLGILVGAVLLSRHQGLHRCLREPKNAPRVLHSEEGTRIGREMEGLSGGYQPPRMEEERA